MQSVVDAAIFMKNKRNYTQYRQVKGITYEIVCAFTIVSIISTASFD